eukprot:3868695-Prymnesium_polylepis.1
MSDADEALPGSTTSEIERPLYWDVAHSPGSEQWGWHCHLLPSLEWSRQAHMNFVNVSATLDCHCISHSYRAVTPSSSACELEAALAAQPSRPTFLAWLESASMRGPAAMAMVAESMAERRISANTTRYWLRTCVEWRVPKWLLGGGRLRARVFHLGTERWWYIMWSDHAQGFFQGLGREVQSATESKALGLD